LPKCSISRQKIDIDKKARFHYQVGYWFRLIDASICWARDEADTQFAIFAWLALKKQCLIFCLIFLLDFEEFLCTVTTRDRGIAQQRRLRKIHDLAYESIGCPMNRFAEFEAAILVDQVIQTKQLIEQIDAQIDQAASAFIEYHCLLTIPGFGPYVSALVLAKIGDPFRFENRGQVVKMAGYDLSANRSGKSSDKATPVISKKGSNALRYALYQAALIASARNSNFIRYFTNTLKGREKERGIKVKMRVKLAAKMLIIAWTLMKKRIDFNPDFLLNDE
jgi:transposase